MSETAWYIRARGRVTGPFDRTQLENLRNRGQLARFHEISQDKQVWVSAATLELFAMPGLSTSPTVNRSDAVGYILEGDPNPQLDVPNTGGWFYARNGVSTGPVNLADLQRLADQNEIEPDTLVWKEGMSGWTACRDATQVNFKPRNPPVPQTVNPGPAAGYTHSPVPGIAPAYRAAGSVHSDLLPQTSGLAMASLILGLLWLCGIGSILATIFGAVALNQISKSHGTITGKGMAIAGLVLGILGLGGLFFPVVYYQVITLPLR